MNELPDIETVRTEALRKLGRNIVNFSKIEGSLKQLLSISQVSGPLKTTSAQILERMHKRQRRPLGVLVAEFNKNILRNPEQVTPPETVDEPWFSVSLTLGSSDISHKECKQRLNTLVAERNRLIHQDLAHLDTTSVEDYSKLINLLDEQHPRLLTQLDELKWLTEGLIETIQGMRQSPEFLKLLSELEESN